MQLPLFNDNGEDTLTGAATVELEGRPIFWDEEEKLKTLSLKYLLAGTRKFNLYFRYHNGKNWLGWNLLKLNDDNLTYDFEDTDSNGIYLQFNMELQQFYIEGMTGGQIKAVGVSGTANADFYNGYANIIKN